VWIYFRLWSGGLCSAATTGYYLTAFQAENLPPSGQGSGTQQPTPTVAVLIPLRGRFIYFLCKPQRAPSPVLSFLEYRRDSETHMSGRWHYVIVVSFVIGGLAFPPIQRAASLDLSESRTHNGSINHASANRRLATGIWAGEHISLEVTEQGAKVEYDCAHGTIPRRILLDRRGRFDIVGQHAAEHGGPVRRDEQLTSLPVRFTGQVNGKRMTLTIRNSVTKELIGNFILYYGQEPRLMKCR
jgi:hypothetical protein